MRTLRLRFGPVKKINEGEYQADQALVKPEIHSENDRLSKLTISQNMILLLLTGNASIDFQSNHAISVTCKPKI